MSRRPPKSKRTYTHFPYASLFRSIGRREAEAGARIGSARAVAGGDAPIERHVRADPEPRRDRIGEHILIRFRMDRIRRIIEGTGDRLIKALLVVPVTATDL